VVYTREDFVARVREITGGKGVPVVYDPVGKTTFQGSLQCLRPRGLMVSFGNASGPVPPVDPIQLSTRGSLYLTRPTLANYTATREELEETANDLFRMVTSGKIRVEPSATYPLADAARAHRDLESRKTTGSLLLLP
jgi:NADPH2:quinone reductase